MIFIRFPQDNKKPPELVIELPKDWQMEQFDHAVVTGVKLLCGQYQHLVERALLAARQPAPSQQTVVEQAPQPAPKMEELKHAQTC